MALGIFYHLIIVSISSEDKRLCSGPYCHTERSTMSEICKKMSYKYKFSILKSLTRTLLCVARSGNDHIRLTAFFKYVFEERIKGLY